MTTPPYLRRVSPAASCFGCAGGEAPTLDDNDVAPLLDVETGGGDRRGRPSAEEMRTGKQPRREPTTTDAEMMHEWNRAGVMAIKCVVRVQTVCAAFGWNIWDLCHAYKTERVISTN
ncbi:hypothetical protein OsJ_08109 [Oryza sativa Japonica Group]|uniref:Uncharacterized protein n=1 Tax=Oryza sativa subsp. japonica TaxID=39947 RepID=B9F2B5_ORYSJ|nr:hypothetical protein OsJ_08109 [Oryza sativa Japonica Group]